ncbi:MAG TPA: PQQ-binding-like beta-propeller repeat protein [Pyrinomonadaceae bacterium]|jgi:outer membrane protein assembly factor BamB|nr:PQQ-binding-like beta-propeller repeat protein [Pyrinomonadaceae bacterium]
MSSHRLLSAFLTGAAVLSLAIAAQAQDWPQWRGPNRDGNAANSTAAWPKDLQEEWKVTVGLGHASPVVVDKKVYVFARQGEEEVLLSLDVATGKELWRASQPIAFTMHPAATAHGKGPKSTPVVSDGKVFTLGISGVLSCHDARTGKLKWRHEFSKQYPATSPLYGTAMSPVVDRGMVIAHVGGQDKGALTAFDTETGAVKWSNDMDGPAYSSPIIVTLAGVRQVVTFMQKDFVGVDATTGKLLWKLPHKSEYDENSVTAIAYKDTLIYSREAKGLTAIRLTSQAGQIVPQEIWNSKENVLYFSSPVVQGDTLYGFSIMKKGQFFAMNADTGKTLWQSPGRMGDSAVLLNLGGKSLLLLTNEAKLIVLPASAKEYAPAAEYTVANSPTWAHPAITRDHILIKDETTLRSLKIQ